MCSWITAWSRSTVAEREPAGSVAWRRRSFFVVCVCLRSGRPQETMAYPAEQHSRNHPVGRTSRSAFLLPGGAARKPLRLIENMARRDRSSCERFSNVRRGKKAGSKNHSAGVGARLWSEPPACHAAIPGGILSAGRCPQESGHGRPEAHSTGANQGVSPTIGVFHEIPRAAGPLQQTGRSAPLARRASSKPLPLEEKPSQADKRRSDCSTVFTPGRSLPARAPPRRAGRARA
jgi:hypothetical protein